MRASRNLGSLTFLAVLGASIAARADDDAFSDTARELFQKGMKAYDQQKWEQCRAALLAAFAIKRHSQIAGNLAECEMHVGAYRDAAEHAWFFAHTLRPDAPPERRAMAETALRETQKKVGAVVITADVDDADVLVDGKSAGKTPLAAPIFVEPGRHTIEALRAGDAGARATVDAGAGEMREVVLSLKRKEAPPPPPPPPPVVVEKRPLWPVIAAGSVAVVALGVGAGLTLAANGKRADVDALDTKLGTGPVCVGMPAASTVMVCQALNSASVSHDTLNKAALGSFVAGGALAATAVGLGAWRARGPKETTTEKMGVRVAPLLGRGEAGLSVTGAW